MGTAEGYALPLHAPLYFQRVGQKVLWWKGINFTCRADPANLRQFIPQPLELQDDLVTVTITEHYQPGHGLPVYGRVFLHARYPTRSAAIPSSPSPSRMRSSVPTGRSSGCRRCSATKVSSTTRGTP